MLRISRNCYILITQPKFVMLFGVIILMPMLFFTAEGIQLEFFKCPSETLDTEPECTTGTFIDVIRATAAYLGEMNNGRTQCNGGKHRIEFNDIKRSNASCKINLPLLRCHGRQKCSVTPAAANVSLPQCDKGSDSPGRYSDVLFFRYDCYKSEARVILPSTNDVPSDTIDVFSPGFPDVTEKRRYDVTCSISIRPEKETELTIVAKLISIEGMLGDAKIFTCEDSLQLSLSGKPFFCYQEVLIRIRNDNMGNRTGHNWTLKYISDGTVKHKFWIQFNATNVESGDGVNMTISCTNNLPTTTTTVAEAATTTTTTTTITVAATEIMTTKTSTTASDGIPMNSSMEEKQNNDLTTGVSAGAALLVVIIFVIVIVVFFCRKRKRRNKNQPDRPLHPSVPQNNEVSKPYCIVSVITPTPANSHDTNNGVPRQAPRSAKGEEMKTVEYADVVVVPSGAMYSQVNKKDNIMEENEVLKNPNMLDGETIMEENTELYAKEVVPLNKMAKNDKKNPENNEEETIMVENSDLYAKGHADMGDNAMFKDDGYLYDSVSARKLNSNAHDNVGFLNEASQ